MAEKRQHFPLFSLSLCLSRFDGVGDLALKMDPTLKKATLVSDMLIQILLASASGDELFLRRWWTPSRALDLFHKSIIALLRIFLGAFCASFENYVVDPFHQV